MFEKLYIFWANTFIKCKNEGRDGYFILSGTVCKLLLFELYEKSVRQGEFVAIENISSEKKELYWSLAKKYFNAGNREIDIVVTAKAAYALSILASSE